MAEEGEIVMDVEVPVAETTATAEAAPAATEEELLQLAGDADDSGDDSGVEDAGGDVVAEGDAAAGGVPSKADWGSLSKDQAKAQLSHKEYKKWKKMKKSEKKDKKKDKEKKKDKKDKKEDKKSSKKESRKTSRKGDDAKGSKRQRREDGDDTDQNNIELLAAEYAAMEEAQNRQQAATVRRTAKGSTAMKSNIVQLLAQRSSDAQQTVAHMTAARKNDAVARQKGLPPVYRLTIRPGVVSVVQRPHMHEHLVNNGFLDEIAYWLCDRQAGVLAPPDLRTSALDLLMGFDFDGVISVRKKMAAAKAARKGDEDLTQVAEGITAEQLRDSIIGAAVNFVRTHPKEHLENKIKATTLLERMSRTFHEDHEEEAAASGAKWPLMNVQGMGTPFETVKTETEDFQSKCVKIDKEDPTSYMRQPPKRYPKTFITGMFDMTQIVDDERDM